MRQPFVREVVKCLTKEFAIWQPCQGVVSHHVINLLLNAQALFLRIAALCYIQGDADIAKKCTV